MSKITVNIGASKFERDITGKNLLSVISSILPKEKLPPEFDFGDVILRIGGELCDIRAYDINRVFDKDVTLTIAPKGFDPITVGIIYTIVTVASIAASFLLQPTLPTTSGAAKDSPNNSLFGQENTIRLDEQEPNVYGSQVVYPDIITNKGGAWEYVDNQKIVAEGFLVGTGAYEKSEPRFELTRFGLISGQEWSYYEPFDVVPVVQGQFNSESIDGQTLLGPNNDEIQKGVTALADPTVSITITNGELIATVNKNAEWDTIYSNFQTELVTLAYKYKPWIEFQPPSAAPVCLLENRSSTGRLLGMVDNATTYTLTIDASNTDVGDCGAFYDPYLEATEITSYVVNAVLPVKTNELQLSFEFRGGLRGNVEIAVLVQESTGLERYDFSYSADTSNQLYYTEKIAISPPDGDLTISVQRLNDDKENNTDRVQITQAATNSYRYNVNYGNRTMLFTKRRATEQATSIKDAKINLDATRKTITYNTSTGQIDYTLTASRSFADAILHEYTQVQGLPAADLPLDEIYAIYESIPSELGNFDYTFADKEQSIKEKLDIIANVARCVMPFTGEGYAIFRDQQRFPVAQFDARNIAADSPEETSYRGATETATDGVKLKWKNPIGNKFEYVYFVIQGANTVECVYQGGGIYSPSLPKIPYEIDLVGCATIEQAKNRAELECRKLIYINKTVKTKVLVDGENVERGQVVKYADYYQDDVATGEIKSSSGNIHTTYGNIKVPAGDYYISYTNEYGDVSNPIPCTVIDEYHILATLPDVYHADGYLIQCGSRFIISTLTEHDNSLYEVADKVSEEDGSVSLELVQYDERIYPELDEA